MTKKSKSKRPKQERSKPRSIIMRSVTIDEAIALARLRKWNQKLSPTVAAR